MAVVFVLALAALASPAFGQSADIDIDKSGPATASPGEAITYTVTITNLGPQDGDTIVVNDDLPGSVEFDSGSTTVAAGWGCSFPSSGAIGGSVTCNASNLPLGAVRTITINVTIIDEIEAGAIVTNEATVESFINNAAVGEDPAGAERPAESIDPVPTNNSASVSTLIVGPDVTITKSHAGNGTRGQQLTYSIVATNIGNGPTTGTTTVTDTLPAGLTPVSFSGGGWACTLAPLACTRPAGVGAGAVMPTLSLTVMVEQSAAATVINTVNVTTPSDTNTGNNSATDPTQIAAIPTSLTLALSFSTPTYSAVGQVIEVRYLVTNNSATTVTGIVVTDAKVPNITCPQTSLVSGAAMTCTGPYTITAADMTAGTSAFTATVTGSGGATATATGAITAAVIVIVIENDDFVRTRGQLLQIDPPGLHDRVGQVTAGLTESNGDPTFSFAGSFLGGANTAAEDLASGAVALPYKFWIDGKLTLHTRDNGGGGFGQLGLGGDYLVNENLLVGAALYIDWMTDKKTDRTTTGVGYLAGSYVSAEIAEHLTFDGAIFLGGSTNNVAVTVGNSIFSGTFNTQRVVVQAQLDGLWNLDVLTIRPDATLFLRHETVGNYTVRDAQGTVVPVSGFTNTSLNLSGGALFEKAMPLESGLVFIPQAGFRLGITGRGDALALDNPYGSVSVGFALEGEAWKYQSTVELSLWASSLKAATWKGTLAGEF